MQNASSDTEVYGFIDMRFARLQHWLEFQFEAQAALLRKLSGDAVNIGTADPDECRPVSANLEHTFEIKNIFSQSQWNHPDNSLRNSANADVELQALPGALPEPMDITTAKSDIMASPRRSLNRNISPEALPGALPDLTHITRTNSGISVLPKGYYRVAGKKYHETDWQSQLMDVFDELDLDNSGSLDLSELKEAFEEVNLPKMEAFRTMNSMDKSNNCSQVIDRLEWLHMIEEAGRSTDEEDVCMLVDFMQRLAERHNRLGRVYEAPRKRRRTYIIRHDSPMRMLWDMLMILFLLYISMFLPAALGFGQSSALDSFDTLLDIFFCVDVILNFRTTFLDCDDALIVDSRRIVMKYLKSWFLLDFFSSVPFDLLTAGFLPGLAPARLLKIGKIAKVLKLLRISKMGKVCSESELMIKLEERTMTKAHQTAMRVLKLAFVAGMLCHWLACFGEAVNALVPGSSGLDAYFEGEEEPPSGLARYLAAMYWSMTTLSTVGYGDISPKTDAGRAYCMGAMAVGAVFYGYIVGSITSLVSAMDLNQREYNTHMDLVQSWLDQHEKIPKLLRRRVRRHYKLTLSAKSAIDDAIIITELSPELRADIALFLVNENVRRNAMFADLPNSTLSNLVQILQKSHASADEVLVKAGDPGTAMFIIVWGKGRYDKGFPWTPDTSGCFLERRSTLPDLEATARPRQVLIGHSFGEEVLFGLEECYQYTVVTTVPTAYDWISEDRFKDHFRSMPHLRAQMFAGFLKGRGMTEKDVQLLEQPSCES